MDRERIKKPFLPLIIEDWHGNGDVQDMTTSERGTYITLLVQQWIDGDLPADAKKLSKVCGIPSQTLQKFFENFPKLFRSLSKKVQRICNPKLHKLRTGENLDFLVTENRIERGEQNTETNSLRSLLPAQDQSETQSLPEAGQVSPAEWEDPNQTPVTTMNRDRAASSEAARPSFRPKCIKCAGSGWEVFKVPSKIDPLGYTEATRLCSGCTVIEKHLEAAVSRDLSNDNGNRL